MEFFTPGTFLVCFLFVVVVVVVVVDGMEDLCFVVINSKEYAGHTGIHFIVGERWNDSFSIPKGNF